MKKVFFPLIALLAVAACTKVDVDTEWHPLPMPAPARHSYGIDVRFSGDTSHFVRNANFYFVTQQGADSVALLTPTGDTVALPGGTLMMDGIDSLHLRTTASAALFLGRISMVIRDLPDPPASMNLHVELRRNDTLYHSSTYSLTTADISRTLTLSNDPAEIKFE